MYAFTESLRSSWQQLFQSFDSAGLAATESVQPDHDAQVEFSVNDQLYLSSQTIFAHTCGYPYMKRWRSSHVPVCVPVFDIDGCDGVYYRSWFICNKRSARNALADFRHTVVAVNGMESNSGMNVLRQAVSELEPATTFFKETKITGSHYQSMQSVANGSADMAAVDAVSFYFGCQQNPSLTDELLIFDQSVKTVGLPFIHHREDAESAGRIIDRLNVATGKSKNSFLKLAGFQAVAEKDYLPIIEIEQSAIAAGYPLLC